MDVYSPADSADDAERMQQAALSRRERQFGEVIAVLLLVCVNLRDLRENRPFKSVRRATSNKVKHRATKLWLTRQRAFHCTHENIAVPLPLSFENQVTGLNERRNIIGAHI